MQQQVNKSYAINLLLLLSQAIMVFTQHNQQLQQKPQAIDRNIQESSRMETEKFELRNLLGQQLLLNSVSLQAPKLPAKQQYSTGKYKQLLQYKNQDQTTIYDNEIKNNDNNVNIDDDDNDDNNDSENSFYDHYGNGAYAYGYSLPQGVRRFERGYYPYGKEGSNSMTIEGFYTQLRDLGNRKLYELRCYHADSHGYRNMKVQYLSRPPAVHRHILPDVNCFDNNI